MGFLGSALSHRLVCGPRRFIGGDRSLHAGVITDWMYPRDPMTGGSVRLGAVSVDPQMCHLQLIGRALEEPREYSHWRGDKT